MADQTPEETSTPTAPPAPSMNDFAGMIGTAVSDAIEARHPKKVTIGEYMRREAKGRSKLRRDFYENGVHITPRVLSNEEIDLLNQINRSGRYIERLVEVLVKQDGDIQTLYIQYNNKSLEQRFDNARKWKDLVDLCEQVLKAQALENAEDEELKLDRQERVNRANRRQFGEGKNSREARERAEQKLGQGV